MSAQPGTQNLLIECVPTSSFSLNSELQAVWLFCVLLENMPSICLRRNIVTTLLLYYDSVYVQ